MYKIHLHGRMAQRLASRENECQRSKQQCAIVGAGPADLRRQKLAERGYDVALAEAGMVLGGRQRAKGTGLSAWGRVATV